MRAQTFVRLLSRKAGISIKFLDQRIEITKENKVIRISRANVVYLEDMINFFDAYFYSVIPINVNEREIVDFSEPRYHKLRGFEKTPFLFPSLSEPWETAKQYTVFANLKEGDIVLDLGAYAGITSICFSNEVGKTGKILAFEPDSKNRLCAEENIKASSGLFNPNNITLYDHAIWYHCDGISFSTEGAMGSGASSIVGNNRGMTVKVPTITLEKICEMAGLEKINFIKMDIEGAEIEVLECSRKVLEKYKPKLIIEPHPVFGELSTRKCRIVLEEIGYVVREIEQYGASVPLIEATPRAEVLEA